LKWLAKDRYNFVDMVGIGAATGLAWNGLWVESFVVALSSSLLSAFMVFHYKEDSDK